jgi:hypothetical protein
MTTKTTTILYLHLQLAIANGFAISRLPSTLRDIRVHEAAMVAPSIVSGKRKQTTNQTEQNNRIKSTTPTIQVTVDRITCVRMVARMMIPSAR